MGKNAIVGQSGGPTSVINASLAGVFESCKSRGAEIVYGMCNGVAGLLEERVVNAISFFCIVFKILNFLFKKVLNLT